jgi:hypothetical protein
VRTFALVIVLAAAALATAGSGFARPDRSEAALSLARLDVPRNLRVVSYYPADAGWTRMWEPWRLARLAADLRRLRTLNANTVRIVVSPPFFGYPTPAARYTARLRELVAIAGREGLHVQLTLFDWWGEYGDLAGSKRWAATLLAGYVDDPRIAFVELRNEIDPADAAAVAWARELVPWLRAFLRGRTPVTLSVGGVRPLDRLRALHAALPAASRPDFFNAHYFTGGGEAAEDLFRRLRAAVAPTPLWIGELGYPTSATVSGYEGVPLTRSAQEAAQAHYLRLCFTAARRAGLPDPGIWILDDFGPKAIPRSDVQAHEPEYAFGLFRVDGTAKPAASVVRRLFAGGPESGFNGSFEAVVRSGNGTALPGGWSVTVAQGVLVARHRGVARTGHASALISAVGNAAGAAALTIAPVDGSPRRGRRAELSAWIRGRTARGRFRLAIRWFDADHHDIGTGSSPATLPPGDAWRRVVVRSRPPARAAFARIAIETADLTGAVWIDDVAFAWR